MEKRIYDIAVGEMFTFNGALFVMSPFDPDEEKYLSLCVASSNVNWEIGESYWIYDEEIGEIVSPQILQALFL
jgi:hypothetical protein